MAEGLAAIASSMGAGDMAKVQETQRRAVLGLEAAAVHRTASLSMRMQHSSKQQWSFCFIIHSHSPLSVQLVFTQITILETDMFCLINASRELTLKHHD